MTQPESMKTRAYVYGVDKLNGYDAWRLFSAAATGDSRKIRTLLNKDRRLVNAQYWYQFPIHMAVREGHTKIVQLLLDHGADPGESRFLYRSWDSLLQIARERDYRDIETVLASEMERQFNYSPDFLKLKDAIVARNARSVGAILRRRPDLAWASDTHGNNALHCSVLTRQLGMIERFAALGTPIDAPRADGQSPVVLAVNQACDYWYRGTRNKDHPSIRNAWVIVGDLLARGAEYTLSVAAAVGDQERVEQHLRQDATLASRLDAARVSPLSYAARENHAHIVRLLLAEGASPNTPENLAPHGRALFEACGGNHLETAELLLEHGANPNAEVDSCGCCLTIAEHHHGRQAKPLQTLLRRFGAFTPPYAMNVRQMRQAIQDNHDVVHHEEFLGNVFGKRNATLLQLYLAADPAVPSKMSIHGGATYPQSPALVRTLLAHGLDPNRPDWLGSTALHACAVNGDRTVASVLLDAGANIDAQDFEFRGTPLASAIRHDDYHPAEDDDEAKRQADRRKQMVTFLLKRGASTNVPGTPHWATPLAWARKRGFGDIEAILVEHGAKS